MTGGAGRSALERLERRPATATPNVPPIATNTKCSIVALATSPPAPSGTSVAQMADRTRQREVCQVRAGNQEHRTNRAE
jgi:hypothetical protein